MGPWRGRFEDGLQKGLWKADENCRIHVEKHGHSQPWPGRVGVGMSISPLLSYPDLQVSGASI
jgi:hypothetical protein